MNIQEAMESSAFPNKTIKMKLMKLKVDEYHFCHLKLRKNAASCTCETSGKHPFLFDCYSEGNSSIKKSST